MDAREVRDQLPDQHEAREATTPTTCWRSRLSTERIMQAVEEQRRVSQQLEDLRIQQKQRTAHLRVAGLKVIGTLWCLCGVLAGGFALLLILQPTLLDRTLNSLSDSIALLVALTEQIRLGLSLVPSSSWLLSAAALVVVLLTGLWIRLMRYPQDA